MTIFTFTIPGPPVGKGRPRLGRGGHVYTPAKTAAYEKKVRVLALAALGGRCSLAKGPVGVTIVLQVPWPQRVPKRLREAYRDEGCFFVGRPDLDNCAKAILDAMNGVIYLDDAQVSQLQIQRYRGPIAQVTVTVEGL